MHHNTLGRTGLNVTRLGYGSMGLRGPRTWGVRVVSDAAGWLGRVIAIDDAPVRDRGCRVRKHGTCMAPVPLDWG